jgi:hypothetical protein
MKKLLLITLAVAGLVFSSAPRSEAGVAVGIGIGLPVVYPYPPYPYPYAYPYPYYGFYGGPSFYVGPGFYWYHGHRVFIARHAHHFVR